MSADEHAGPRKELDVRLTAYLPAVVRRHLEKQDTAAPLRVPNTHQSTVVSMFADVSGFTAMTESLAARGPVGAEYLAKHLNSYFEQLLRLISGAGGDVFKFAGDAMLVFWPENKDDTLQSLLRRAIQCALRIQEHLHKAELAPGVVLSVKMGIGIGRATIAHLGGESDGAIDRIEYIAVGPALQQAFDCEHRAEAGDVICSPECWKMVGQFFAGDPVDASSGYHKVKSVELPIKLCSRRPSFTRDDAQLHARMKQYVSRAVWPYLDAHDEFWGSELRDVTVLFINLGFSEEDLSTMLDMAGLQKLQDAFSLVQKCIYEYEGTINKFLVDDKGSTVIAAFGLPPVTHENDPIRGILASLAICAALGKLDLKASVGITTGTALCGVVGHQGNRREYTVLGDIVNLSARLMQKAKSERGGVITDEATKNYTQDTLHFEERPEIMVKGKNDSIKIHRPYPRMSILMEFHLSQTGAAPMAPSPTTTPSMHHRSNRAVVPMRNVMENMHRIQVRDAQRRLSRRGVTLTVNRPAIVESDSFSRIRNDLLEHCSQLNPFSPSGAFVLEGDIGVGKTFLLSAALGSPEAGSYNVLQGTACPFSTGKPYAVWAELITKCALEQQAPTTPKSTASVFSEETYSLNSPSSAAPSLQNGTSANQQPGTGGSREVERRRQVARFVRRKIIEGAAPNTTLVRYAYLLDSILETNFAEVGDNEEDGLGRFGSAATTSRTVKLFGNDTENAELSKKKESNTKDSVENNQEEDHRGKSLTQSAPSYAHPSATSPGKLLKVKEEEIAAWFLNLLEMDLAQREEAMASMEPQNGSSTTSQKRKAARMRVESEWRPADLDLSGILLLCALFAISRNKSTVFCLDNAMYMDEKSWILAAIVIKYFTNCLVVVGTRPPSFALNENTESSSFRKQLRALKQLNSSVCHVLEPLGADEVEALARQILGVNHIPSELAEVFVSRSQGNPLFLHEIIADMQRQQVIHIDVKRRTCQMQVQEPWGDKSSASCCFYCHAKFTTFKEKHRCKCCGYVFCAACTPKACRRKLPGGSGDPVRHCCSCYTIASTRRASADRTIAAAAGALLGGLSGNVPTRHKSRMRSIFQASDHTPTNTFAHALKNRVALRPPRTIKSVLTTMLDQLTVSQRMLMKTASVIGAVFDKELLRSASPIAAHLLRFEDDLDELERLSMIRRVDNFIGVVPLGNNTGKTGLKSKFEFAHGFMQDVLRAQMLCSQLDKLQARVADVREQQQKELRQKFFEKANDSLSRTPYPLSISISPPAETALNNNCSSNNSTSTQGIIQGVRRALTPTRRGGSRSPPRNRSVESGQTGENGLARSSSHSSLDRYSSASTTNIVQPEAASRNNSSQEHESAHDDSATPAYLSQLRALGGLGATVLPLPFVSAPPPRAMTRTTFMRLKAGSVFVKKRSSVFSRLTNTRQWKKRFAVLQSARLLLQYDEDDGSGGGCEAGASLFLKGAKVSACDPEVASKVNCFQLEVDQWTKGKYLMSERRFFVIGVQSDEEVDNWVYMIRYAIEALENQASG